MASADASYYAGYTSGFRNGQDSAQAVIGIHYIPTAEERAASIDFKGDENFRQGWLDGWARAVQPYREFQARELHVTTSQDWVNRRFPPYWKGVTSA